MSYYSSNYKLVFVNTHPVQYFSPLFREISSEPDIDFTAYYQGYGGARNAVYDTGFDREIKWDIPLLDGYDYKVFNENGDENVFRTLKKNQPDAVILHGWTRAIYWRTAFAAWQRNIPIFLHVETPLNQERHKTGLTTFARKGMTRSLLSRIDAGLFIGSQNRKFYRHYGMPEEQLFFTPYAVDNDRFMRSSRKLEGKEAAIRRDIGLPEDAIVILFVGKLSEKKRPLDLLKAFERLKNEACDRTKPLCLLFVGDGKLSDSLKNYQLKHDISDVHFAGFVNQTDLPPYYKASDIFVLPSGQGETWGLVVNEAMCFGLPVIISDVPGSGFDLVKNGQNGFRYPMGNIDALSDRLRIVVNNKNLRHLFGKYSKKEISNYSFERDIKGIRAALEWIN